MSLAAQVGHCGMACDDWHGASRTDRRHEMGIQIFVEPNDLIRHITSIEIITESDEDCHFTWKSAIVTFINKAIFIFNLDDDYFWADYNDWGSNKAILKPIIEEFNIKHMIS
jgi:hypothetical protein